MKPYYYLRLGTDPLEAARSYRSKARAIRAYLACARELERYGQPIEASIHIAQCRAQTVEYPDFVLSIGPRGGLRCERA